MNNAKQPEEPEGPPARASLGALLRQVGRVGRSAVDPDVALRAQVLVLYAILAVLVGLSYAAIHFAYGAVGIGVLLLVFAGLNGILLVRLWTHGNVMAVAQGVAVVAVASISAAIYFTGGLRLTNVSPFFVIIVGAVFLLGWKGLPWAILAVLVPLGYQVASWSGFVFPDHVAPEGRGLDAFITWFSSALLVLLFVACYEGARGLAMKRRLEAEQARSQFLANISHELRTPLHAIMGMNRQLEQAGLEEAARRAVDLSQLNAQALLALLNDLLELASMERQRFTLHTTDFDPVATTEQVAQVIGHSCQEKGLQFSVHVAADAPRWVRGDERRLQQVLMNLASNAVKYTAKGSVRVTMERAQANENRRACRFTVTDTGIGIADSDRDRIFHQFTQADGSLARPYDGAGLGLHIAREIVSAMKGSIEVNTVPGEGSTFSFIVPFAEADSQPARLAVPEPQAEGPWPLEVLLVDDTKVNREMASAMLEDLCTKVVVATSGEQALAMWEDARPDLILMDIQMPVMDGLEATRIIRERERAAQEPAVPIIVLTGHGTEHQRQQCLEAGASDCLFKPFGFDDLHEAIRPFAGQGKGPAAEC